MNDWNPDDYRTPRTLPHSGWAGEGPRESAGMPRAWVVGVVLLVLLLVARAVAR
jgi:hypothetical protein